MEFLAGEKLTKAMRELCKQRPLKIAIAYWGKNALTLLELHSNRKDTRVLCCLKGGKSHPDVIKRFGNRAKQIDNLHAKVIWSPQAAIVGSANASSNGLPEEEKSARGLVEAGIHVADKKTLKQIEKWFDRECGRATVITLNDLDDARKALEARKRKFAEQERKLTKPSLIEALRADDVREDVYFYLYEHYNSNEEDDQAIPDAKKNYPGLDVDPYFFSESPRNGYFPARSYLIDVRYHNRTIPGKIYRRKTFDHPQIEQVQVDGEDVWRMFVSVTDPKDFPYVLEKDDKKLIKAAARELWEEGRKGVEDDRIISLQRTKSILRGHIT
jgi:hypothetical protein